MYSSSLISAVYACEACTWLPWQESTWRQPTRLTSGYITSWVYWGPSTPCECSCFDGNFHIRCDMFPTGWCEFDGWVFLLLGPEIRLYQSRLFWILLPESSPFALELACRKTTDREEQYHKWVSPLSKDWMSWLYSWCLKRAGMILPEG